MPAVDLFRDCPGYAEMARREREIRDVPFLGLPETVAGLDCAPLTLRRLMWLQMVKSPFLTTATPEELLEKPNLATDIIGFFWITSPVFDPGNRRRRKQFDRTIEKSRLLQKPAAEVVAEIKTYMAEAFMDAEEGPQEKSFYSSAAGTTYLCHKLFGLEIDVWENGWLRRFWRAVTGKPNALDIPLKIIRQYVRAHRNSQNPTIFTNRLSDTKVREWLYPQAPKSNAATN